MVLKCFACTILQLSMIFILSQFSTLLSEGSDGTSSERMNTKSVDAMVLLNMESSAISLVDGCGNNEYEIECHEKYCYVKTKSVSAWDTLLMCHKKVTVLYELLSACLAENTDADKNCSLKKGYDARHRVALLVLLIWLNIKWIKMVFLLKLLVIFISYSCLVAFALQMHAKALMLSNNFVYRTCMRTSRNCHLSSEVIPYIFFKNILFCWKL